MTKTMIKNNTEPAALSIAIDGPASSGKSTLAKRLAKTLNYTYLDTGAMYRAITKLALDHNVAPEPSDALDALLADCVILFEAKDDDTQRVLLNGDDVTDAIRTDVVSDHVSAYATLEPVRTALVAMQRDYAKQFPGIVMDGRDIGTVVLPNADVKFFLTASVMERAKRRFRENQEKGYSEQTLEEIAESIRQRDEMDSTRALAPLKQADDAVVIDSTGKSIDAVAEEMLTVIREKRANQ